MENSQSDNRNSVNNSNTIAAMQACVDHAHALLESARAVQAAGHPNIAYHLAALTLEELGRRELIVVQKASVTRPVPPAWIHKHIENQAPFTKGQK